MIKRGLRTEDGAGGTGEQKAIVIERAVADDVDALIDMLRLHPPMFWIRCVSDADLARFLRFAIASPRGAILVAHDDERGDSAGYVLAVRDVHRFWATFAARHPLLAARIAGHRARRLLRLRRERAERAAAGALHPSLPEFTWTPSQPGAARIIGLYVRREYRRRGIARDLYFRLFEGLQAQGCRRVEEYMARDYTSHAGNLPETCGWRVEPVRCGGYKISRELSP